MRAVIQRVNNASVEVNSEIVGKINKGILVFVGISKNFKEEKLDWFVNKILNLRLWTSDKKGFDLNIEQINGEILIVSQFTLFGDCSSSNKPNFNDAKDYEDAEKIYNRFVEKIKSKTNLNVQTGEFGAMMKVNLENDGPVTIILEK
jgi:D-tyrosyl-tRNA(Tyr) deacylase